jgi:rod shape determining protein RodA
MSSFTGSNYHFYRQLTWLGVSLLVFAGASLVDWRFLRHSRMVVILFVIGVALLALLVSFGHVARGAQSWFSFGRLALQPSDFVKLILVLVLAKYFSRRHVEIAHYRHILISGLYALVPFVLILIQPALGSAITIFLVWLGLVIFAGLSKRHLLIVFATGLAAFIILWFFVLLPYQKARITTFINPLQDIRGAGYNVYQSTVAVGSGRLLGKGVGYGTQSRLQFLPEYQTDFIFAAFAEEWGFVGVFIMFGLFGIVIWRILKAAVVAETNFEALFGVGLAITFIAQFTINVGMNLGLLPVTGLTLPFVSYGGSHLLAEFLALGMLMGMRAYSRAYNRGDIKNEFLGIA